MWTGWIVCCPTHNVGHSIGVAPRAWLSGTIRSRAELSSALLIRLLSIGGIYTLAGLTLSPIANLLSVGLPEYSGSVYIAAFASGALGLGLISSYSSNLEKRASSINRMLLLLGICIPLLILPVTPDVFVWGFSGLVACAALYFLHKGHRRISEMEFITF